MAARRFGELRAWQAAEAYKKAVLRLCQHAPLSMDRRLREQLESAATAPSAHLAEGFGRFSPLDFARFAVMARASMMESQVHLRTAEDKQHISQSVRADHDALAETAIGEITGLVKYLQSAEALLKSRTIRDHQSTKPRRANDSDSE